MPSPEPLQIHLVLPPGGHLGVREVFATWLGLADASLIELGALPQGQAGQRLMALRYIIANASTWDRHFNWRGPLGKLQDGAVEQIEALLGQIALAKATLEGRLERFDDAWIEALLTAPRCLFRTPQTKKALQALVAIELSAQLRGRLRAALTGRAAALHRTSPQTLDLVYLAALELTALPATTVSAGQLRYVIIADKGEMGVRAVRETIALGKIPVTLFSLQDDARSLQVRLTEANGGFGVGLRGSFRESYANYTQIAERLLEEFEARFGERWRDELACAALYPGYGPLAENAAAIRHFRRHGIVFIGPMQDVVERVGDKRQFRLMAQRLDPRAVTPGLIIDAHDPQEILRLIEEGFSRGQFAFPGRVKAANGGGGRGQAVVSGPEGLPAAISKVLGEIESNGWDPGVMFEQNIQETIHLEVQVLRDRYGNARHFGMRDCSEQRASQKIQEEAPPALLRTLPELRATIEALAVSIADQAGYVGAGTVELMFKDGSFYLLEMNTRIQVEHPVTEMSHRIARGRRREPLNLVQWQLRLADGQPIDFAQKDVVCTHVAREFRINAESWHPTLKDSRDGKLGLFVPNAGRFEVIEVVDKASLLDALRGLRGLEDVEVRFDCGFEPGDTLVNKDPTFGKLLVAVKATDPEAAYELLRQACIMVLKRTHISGRQVRPDGRLADGEFKTNLSDHLRILQADILKRHSKGNERGRHVNWVVNALRQDAEAAPQRRSA
jgi:acetyl/propionyl-CoA carboxylase alpha subunit